MKLAVFAVTLGSVLIISCNNLPSNNSNSADASLKERSKESYQRGTLGYDLQFLQKYDSGLVQLKAGEANVLVSPKYQGKVFTSSASGESGQSYGWINYKAFDGPVNRHMNAYGGENRLWLGPEGGKYSLFFNPGDLMQFNNWKTPAAIDTEAWQVVSSDEQSVLLQKNLLLKNYTGNLLAMQIDRSVNILAKDSIEKLLGVKLENKVQSVGYATSNKLTNTGKAEWTEQTGMPCIWILDMFNPSPSTTIVIPYKSSINNAKVATTDYFGEIAADRIKLTGKNLYFKADGKSRGKLGIAPSNVLPIAGSYDAMNNVLTITSFTVDNKARYLNQEWNTKKPAFSGDAMNAYNDGPLADGSQMGPFYEIESVSPAAALKHGESLLHEHNVYHFSGDKSQLNTLSQKLLGASLDEIQKAFQ
jgi:hypothetical protein